MQHPDKQTAAPPGYAWEGDDLVPTCQPDYGEAEPEVDGRGAELLRWALLGIIGETGAGLHADGARVRAAAMAFLVKLYDSQKQAADAVKVSESRMSRAVREARAALIRQAKPH
jgi:hypothetical protein